MALIDEDTGREHITDDAEECWCNHQVVKVEAAE